MNNFEKRGQDQEDIAEDIRKKISSIREKETVKNQYFSSQTNTQQNPLTPEKPQPQKPLISTKEESTKLKENKQNKTPKKTLLIIIITILLILIFILTYLFLNHVNQEHNRDLSTQLANVTIYNEQKATVQLSPDINLEGLNLIEIIFSSTDDTEYPYFPDYVDSEYEIHASDLGLINFEKIISVQIFLEHKQQTTPLNETTNQTTTNTTGQSSTTDLGGGRGGGDDGGGTPTPTCSDQQGCSSLGNFCDANTSYTCILGADGCYDKINITECNVTQQCLNGTCKIIPDCNTNTDCTEYFNDCSYGTCNSTGKCEINYNLTDVCRQAAGECDLEEVCSGINELCPSDVFKTDTTSCNSGQGKCQEGTCVELQCQGNDENCGDYPSCINCTSLNYCTGTALTKYTCSDQECASQEITCQDCSCNCGGYNQDETQENQNCNDGKDNDCDTTLDLTDSGCFPDRVSYYKFENNANDQNNRNNGELINNPQYTPGLSGVSIKVAGGNHVSIPDSPSLDIQDEITLIAWVNRTSHIAHGKVLIKRFDDYNTNPWELYTLDFKGPNPGYPCFILSNGSFDNQEILCAETNPLPFNQWHQIAGTYNTTLMSLYIDGSLITTKPTSIKIGTNNLPATIGARNYSNFYTTGEIDEVMIFNKSLSQTEILNIYSQQNPQLPNLSPFSNFWKWIKKIIS